MSPVELIALSLGLSIAVAAIGGLAAAGLERLSGDATLRDRAWAAALYLPALPPLAVALTLLTPAPVVTMTDLPSQGVASPVVAVASATAPVVPAFSLDSGVLALGVLALSGLLVAARLVSLARRTARLNRLVARARLVSPATQTAVSATARSLGIAPPAVRVTATGPDALLAGLIRPVLILPMALADSPDAPATRAVVTHELAHLKRGDHRAVWIEEALVAVLAVNPLLPLIRARRAAAREEACDALALTGADPVARRAYAQSLIEALRVRADLAPSRPALPALTFTGFQRSQAMRRLKSILTPPATAGRGTLVAALLTGLALLGAAGVATAAVASHREATIAVAVQDDADRDDAQASAQAAARMAASAARNTLSPEQRARFDNPSVADYRRICASGDPADGGFCAGVIFSQLGESGVCTPAAIDDKDVKVSGPALGTLVDRAKAQFDAIPTASAQTLPQLALSALRRAYPCQAAAEAATAQRAASIASAQASGTVPVAGTTRLTIKVSQDDTPFVIGRGFTLAVSMTGENAGVRTVTSSETPLAPDTSIGRLVFFDLDPKVYPQRMPGHAYTLKAEIKDSRGRVVYASDPSTLRLAPMSEAQLATLRPELMLKRAGLTTP